jgi:hypothetical protein
VQKRESLKLPSELQNKLAGRLKKWQKSHSLGVKVYSARKHWLAVNAGDKFEKSGGRILVKNIKRFLKKIGRKFSSYVGDITFKRTEGNFGIITIQHHDHLLTVLSSILNSDVARNLTDVKEDSANTTSAVVTGAASAAAAAAQPSPSPVAAPAVSAAAPSGVDEKQAIKSAQELAEKWVYVDYFKDPNFHSELLALKKLNGDAVKVFNEACKAKVKDSVAKAKMVGDKVMLDEKVVTNPAILKAYNEAIAKAKETAAAAATMSRWSAAATMSLWSAAAASGGGGQPSAPSTTALAAASLTKALQTGNSSGAAAAAAVPVAGVARAAAPAPAAAEQRGPDSATVRMDIG